MTSTEIHPMKSRTFLSFTGTRLLTLLLKIVAEVFKDRADTINNYLDTHKVNFTDFHQVYQLMTAIK